MHKNEIENIDILNNLDLTEDYSTDNSEVNKINENIIVSNKLYNEKKEVETIDVDTILFDNNLDIKKSIENEQISNEKNILEALYENNKTSKTETKKKKNMFSGIIFLIKYAFTSSLIFGVLLVSTNYSAYINIAKGYIFEGEMRTTEQNIISSVEASNIKEKYSEEKINDIVEDKKENKLSIRKMKKEHDKKNINLNIEIVPYENRVIIPKIGKNIPLLDIKNRNIEGEKELNDIFMDELKNGIIRYPGSAKPGENGTSFIFGHSSNFPWVKGEYNDVFALLDKVEFGDEIITYYGQEKYTYKIREKKVITPGDVSVLERNKDKSEITLMTCWPIGTTLNRLIVVGELVKNK